MRQFESVQKMRQNIFFVRACHMKYLLNLNLLGSDINRCFAYYSVLNRL